MRLNREICNDIHIFPSIRSLVFVWNQGFMCWAGIWIPEQSRSKAGETVWPPGDDHAGSWVWRAGRSARKAAGVLWLHHRWASSPGYLLSFQSFSFMEEFVLKKKPHFRLCFYTLEGRFHHPDVLQVVSSLNEQRGTSSKEMKESQTDGSESKH